MNLPAIFKRKHQIAEDPLVLAFFRTTVRGERFTAFVRAVHAQLPKYVPFEHVRDSLLHLAGHELRARELDLAAWRLAANLKRLRLGPIRPWSGQSCHEWLPVHIVGVDPANNRRGDPGATLSLMFLAGEAVGDVIYKFWSSKYAAFVSGLMGFSKPWRDRPYEDIRQLFGLRFSVRLSPELSKERPDFDKIDVTTSQHKFNVELLRKRGRLDAKEFACPMKFPLSVACHRCAVGADRCPAATHPRTYVKRPCVQCSHPGWFDPDKPGRNFCVSCRQVQLAKERRQHRARSSA